MKAGQLHYADLYEAGVRPVLVVSREPLNRGGYAVVVPITSAHFERRSRLPNCVPLKAGQFGLTKDCVVQCEAVLTIERAQVQAGGPIGELDDMAVRQVIRAIGYVIESDCEPA